MAKQLCNDRGFMTQPRRTLLLLVAVLAVTLGGYWWLTVHDPRIRFLPGEGSAQWIVYPVPPDPGLQPVVEQKAVFRRSFSLDQVPPNALFRIRALGRCRLTINNVEVILPHDMAASWKRPVERDAPRLLHPGTNDIEATVTFDYGPPALWLSMTGDGLELITDDQWEVSLAGAISQPARRASAPPIIGEGHSLAGGERTIDSLRAVGPILLLFVGLSLGLLTLAHFWEQRQASLPGKGSPWPRRVLILCALMWVGLFCNNLRSLLFPLGFDSNAHLEYIRYLQDRASLPLADDGWQMHQPPLAYLISALLLQPLGLSVNDVGAVVVLRLLSLVLGLLQLMLVYVSLKRILPDRPLGQVVGLVVCAFLPAELYLFHYVTNETLLATLGTASVYLCLRVLQTDPASPRLSIGLGLCLGAALLTKVTALVLVIVVLIVLVGRLLVRGERSWRPWVEGVGLPLLGVLLVSGWHYGRVWAHFGTPLIGSYDPASGFTWWQTPGYGTLANLCRFGRSLQEPFFSVFAGLPDGVYSTLWGDGLWGGTAAHHARPPWNYNLMAAGYLLALLPTLLIVTGLVIVTVKLVREPRAEGFLLVGLSYSLGVAMIYHYLRLPYACHIKAFYLLMAVVPLGAFAAEGFDLLTQPRKIAAAALGVALGTWALTSFASYWVLQDAPATQAWLGTQWMYKQDADTAETCFQKALQADPGNTLARQGWIELLSRTRRTDEARRQMQQWLEKRPDSIDARLTLATMHLQEGKLDQVRELLQPLADAGTQRADVYQLLGVVRNRQGESEQAISLFRRGLALAPGNAGLHAELSAVLAQKGETESAIEHAWLAHKIQPGEALVKNALARLLATAADARLRDGATAEKLARNACERTSYRNPHLMDTLAAAYAELGRFDEAVQMQKKALETLKGPESALESMKMRLQLYEAGRAFHEGR